MDRRTISFLAIRDERVTPYGIGRRLETTRNETELLRAEQRTRKLAEFLEETNRPCEQPRQSLRCSKPRLFLTATDISDSKQNKRVRGFKTDSLPIEVKLGSLRRNLQCWPLLAN